MVRGSRPRCRSGRPRSSHGARRRGSSLLPRSPPDRRADHRPRDARGRYTVVSTNPSASGNQTGRRPLTGDSARRARPCRTTSLPATGARTATRTLMNSTGTSGGVKRELFAVRRLEGRRERAARGIGVAAVVGAVGKVDDEIEALAEKAPVGEPLEARRLELQAGVAHDGARLVLEARGTPPRARRDRRDRAGSRPSRRDRHAPAPREGRAPRRRRPTADRSPGSARACARRGRRGRARRRRCRGARSRADRARARRCAPGRRSPCSR